MKSDAEYEFPTRLRELIDTVGGLQSMSNLAGIDQRLLAKYRDGASKPGLDKLIAIARAGNVTLDWLATGAKPAPVNASNSVDDDITDEQIRRADAALAAGETLDTVLEGDPHLLQFDVRILRQIIIEVLRGYGGAKPYSDAQNILRWHDYFLSKYTKGLAEGKLVSNVLLEINDEIARLGSSLFADAEEAAQKIFNQNNNSQ